MTPQVALDLSQDGIALLSRVPDGGPDGPWWMEGAVRLDDPAFSEGLVRLRERAERRHGPDFTSILIMPESQLLLTVLERDDRPPEATIRAALAGRTPYPVEDLAFDWIRKGDRLHVAVVALETLLEAETFASEHGLRPVAFAAAPQDAAFPGVARFGRTGVADTFLDGDALDIALPREAIRTIPAPPLAEPEPEPEPEEPPAQEAVAPEPEETPVPEPDLAVDDGAEPDAPVEAEAAVDPEPEPEPQPEPEPETPEVAVVAPPPPIDVPAPPPAPAATEAAPAPEAPDAEDEPDAEATPPVTPTAAPKPAAPVAEPRFASRRGRETKRPLAAAVAGSALGRLRPRLGTLGGGSSASRAEPRLAAAPPDAPVGATEPHRPRLAATPASDRAAQIKKAAAAGPAIRAKGVEPTLRAKAGSEAEALALPGYAREKARQAGRPGPEGRPRLGLWLTLGLLVAMLLIAAWSILFLPNAPLAGLFRGDPEAPVVAEAPAGATPEATTVAIAPPDPLVEDTEADGVTLAALDPAPDAPPAVLLPERASGAATDLEVIAPPAPLDLAPTVDVPEAEGVEVASVDPEVAATPRSADASEADAEAPELAEVEAGETDGPTGALLQPAGPVAPAEGALDDLYVASIDPDVAQGDAVALPAAPEVADAPPAVQPAPEAGARFALDGRGLVSPSPEGTAAPGGYTVRAGAPAIATRPRPVRDAVVAETEAAPLDGLTEAQRAELLRVRPRPRPADAAERVERAQNGGLLRAELAQTRPTPRPASAQAVAAAVQAANAAAAASLQATEAARAAEDEEAARAAAAAAANIAVSRLAIPQSERPDSRPRSVERAAARIVQRRQEQREAAPATPPAGQADRGTQRTTAAPTSVARAATERNVLRLNQINLIGVYGRPSSRRALVRLSNGRYVKVEVGDRLDRGRVVAIGDRQLQYQRGGRNIVLRMPRV